MPLRDFAPWVERGSFQAFKDALNQGEADKQAAAAKGIAASGGGVKALVVKGGAGYSRKQIEELEAQAKIYKAKGLAWMKVVTSAACGGGGQGSAFLDGGAAKFFADSAGAPADGVLARSIIEGLEAGPGDLILLVADPRRSIANTALGAVGSKLGRDLGLVPGGGTSAAGAARPGRFEFVWIVDFPMFEFNEEENHWEAAHHMFTWPQEKYHAVLESDPGSVKGDLYDLVLNGYELASGSIRIHDPELQKRIFTIVGIGPEEAERKFGFLTGAFKYGAPPHGGIAPGLDRLVMLMAGETSIKEVIAFPKNSFAVSPMDDSPGEVDQKQLDELHLQVVRDGE
jgi:aspartyl-tRNA synthetase